MVDHLVSRKVGAAWQMSTRDPRINQMAIICRIGSGKCGILTSPILYEHPDQEGGLSLGLHPK